MPTTNNTPCKWFRHYETEFESWFDTFYKIICYHQPAASSHQLPTYLEWLSICIFWHTHTQQRNLIHSHVLIANIQEKINPYKPFQWNSLNFIMYFWFGPCFVSVWSTCLWQKMKYNWFSGTWDSGRYILLHICYSIPFAAIESLKEAPIVLCIQFTQNKAINSIHCLFTQNKQIIANVKIIIEIK